MKLTDIRAFKSALESLSNSSAFTVSAQKVSCDLEGVNSPYSSHTTCKYSHSWVDGPAVLFDNSKYKVVVYAGPIALDEDTAKSLLGSPSEDEELVLVQVPAAFVAPLFSRIHEFFPIEQKATLVSLARYRRKLIGYEEDGTPIFAGATAEEGAA